MVVYIWSHVKYLTYDQEGELPVFFFVIDCPSKFTDEKKLYIRLYKYSNWLPRFTK